jgi:site-specific recombinase XerD
MPEISRRDIPNAPTVAYLAALQDAARQLKDDAQAAGTRRVYTSAWRGFEAWCTDMGESSLPAGETTIIAYVAHLEMSGAALSTAVRHLAAIRWYHADAGADLQTGANLKTIMKGYARRHGRAARTQAQGLRTEHVTRIVSVLDPGRPKDVRDRALILLGFAGGFRRSELAALDVADVTRHDDGLLVLVRRSKADQEGRGSTKAVPYGRHPQTCPVSAYRRWLELSGVEDGKVFRAVRKNGAVWGGGITDQVVAAVVRDRALAVGLDGRWSGHSLRRGFATEAAANGVARHQIMQDGGWRSAAVDVYIVAGSRFGEVSGSRLGL